MDSTEYTDLEARTGRILELKKLDVWKKDLEPWLVIKLATLETQFCSSRDMYERYALVEAYNAIKEFKLWIDEFE